MRALIRAVLFVCLALLLAGFAGGAHPAGDSLAVFAGVFGAIAVLSIPFAGLPRAWSWGLALAVGVAVAPRVADWRAPSAPIEGDAHLVLYQKNLHYPKADRTALLADIRDIGPDALTIQEISPQNRGVLDDLKSDYPHQVYCPFESYGGVAVVTRLPVLPGTAFCKPLRGVAGLRVESPAGPVWLVVIHMHWPWPFQQAEDVKQILPTLSALPGPVVVGGDFNMVLRSHLMARFKAATDSYRPHPARPSFNLPILPIGVTIDHVLAPVSAKAVVSRRPKFASDHRGLVARIVFEPQDAP